MANVDEILKLKELLDKKAITQEEFEKMKNELLEKNIEEKKESTEPIDTSTGKKKKSGCLSTGMMIIIILIVAFVIFGKLVIEPSDERFYNNQEVLEGIVISTEDFSSIVRQCGFSDYTLERDELLDELDGEGTIGIRIKMSLKNSNANGIVYIKDGSIYSVRYADNYLYKDGTIQHTLNEYLVTSY